MTDLNGSPLGHPTTYADRYDRELLFAVERAPQRAALGVGVDLPFRGVDQWTAYELSWLDASGKPCVAIASFSVPADSPRLVESKSVKLYLTAFNQTRFRSERDVAATLARDLTDATRSKVDVALALPSEFAALPRAELAGASIDDEPIVVDDASVAPEALSAGGDIVAETLVTRLFRSICPVTGQPDYASLQIAYRGTKVDRTGLLRYVVSFRRHPGFHELCVERIFVDVWKRCAPQSLSVYARFTRRGGIDINPYRTSGSEPPPVSARTARQ